MPLQNEAQLTGYEGERWFRSQLPRGWIPQKPETDVGIDFVVVISEEGELDKREFRVQVKSSKSFSTTDGWIKLRRIKLSTIDYWFLSTLPTLIVAYDEGKECGYFRWHNDLFDEIKEKYKENNKTLTINIPEKNELNSKGWDKIRENLKWHYRNISLSLAKARDSRSILPTVHDLASVARMLNSIDHQPLPPEERAEKLQHLLALAEMMQHRLVITTLTDLRNELVQNSEGETRLKEWIHAFNSRVIEVFPNFPALKNWAYAPPDFQVAYARNLIHKQRPKLIEAILEMIMLLAPGRFNKKD